MAIELITLASDAAKIPSSVVAVTVAILRFRKWAEDNKSDKALRKVICSLQNPDLIIGLPAWKTDNSPRNTALTLADALAYNEITTAVSKQATEPGPHASEVRPLLPLFRFRHIFVHCIAVR